MKIHFIDNDDGVYNGFTACGKARIWLEPKDETRRKAKVECKSCKRILKSREK